MIFKYNEDSNTLTGLITWIKSINNLNLDDLIPQFEDFRQRMLDTGLSAQEVSEEYNKELNPAVLNYCSTAKASELTQTEFVNSLRKTTLAAKVQSAALKGLADAGNMIAFALITKAIELTVKAVDNWIHRVEKANEAMDTAVDEYESAQSELEKINDELDEQNKRMDELLSKGGKLTYAEEGELKELQEITKELLIQKDIEEKQAEKASKEVARKTVDAYGTQYGKYDLTKDDLLEKLNPVEQNFPFPEDKNDITGNIAAYIRATELLTDAREKYNEAVEKGEDTELLVDDVQFYVDMSSDYEELINNNLSDLLDKKSTIQEEYAKAIERKENGIFSLTSDEKETIKTYEEIANAIRLIYEYTSQSDWNNMEIENIFNMKGVEKTKDELIEMAKEGELTPGTISQYTNLNNAIKDSTLFLKNGQTLSQAFCDEINAAAEQTDDFVYAAKSGAKSYEELLKSAEAGSDAFSAVQKAVSSVNDAFSEQAENGSVSVDTMLSLVSEGYATALSFDTVTGACTLNRDAMMELVQTKIQNQIEDLKILNTNIKAKLLEDGISASTSAQGFYDLIEAKEAYASNDVITSMKNYNDATARIKALENGLKNINKIGSGSYSTSAKASSSAAKKAESDWKKFLDEELNLARAEFDAGLTDFNTYLSKRKDILDKYLAETKISYDDYWDYIKKGYEEQKKYYDSVLSAVTNRLDQEIDSNQAIIDGIEKENDALEEQKDHYDNVISAVLDTIDAKNKEIQSSIDALEKENDEISKQVDEYDSVISAVQKVYEAKQEELGAEQDAIQERIDALREENDEQKRATELQKARYELERSMNQRSRMVYNGDQFVYMADSQTVRDNREKLEDLELENTIASMEKEKEALQQLIDELDRYKNMWAEIADSYQEAKDADIASNILGENYEEEVLQNRIEDIEAFRDRYMEAQANIDDNNGMITSYEEKLEYYDSLKEKWSQLSTLHEENINKQLANELFGSGWESLILEDRLSGFDEFKNSYLDIQNSLDDNTGLIESYNEKISYYQKLKNEWGAVADVYEDSVRAQHAAMMWGQNWEADILSGRITNLNQFKNDYAEIQKTLAQIDIDRYNTQVKAAKNAEKQTYTSDASINSGADITGNYSGVISGGKDDSFEDIIHYRIVDSKTGKMYIDGIESRQTADQWIGKQEESGRYTGSIIGRMKVEKYARGGVVRDTASDLDDWIAQVCREDRIVAVSANERVLTEDQNRGFEKLVAMIPSLMADRYLPGRTPGFDIRELNQIQNTRPVSFSTGDIILNNVQNVDGLAKAIELSFPHAMMRRMQQR